MHVECPKCYEPLILSYNYSPRSDVNCYDGECENCDKWYLVSAAIEETKNGRYESVFDVEEE